MTQHEILEASDQTKEGSILRTRGFVLDSLANSEPRIRDILDKGDEFLSLIHSVCSPNQIDPDGSTWTTLNTALEVAEYHVDAAVWEAIKHLIRSAPSA